MSGMRDWRPDVVECLFGQQHLYNILTAWLQDPQNIPQNLLLAGPYGCGKTSIARMLAKKIISSESDLIEINAAEARGIDDVRSWSESSRFSPFGKGKVYIIDELHQMTSAAQSALLKVIEEPPPLVYWFLCTTEPSRLLPAIRSRCSRVEVKTLNLDETKKFLSWITSGTLKEDLATQIYYLADGHARDIIRHAEIALSTGCVSADQMNQVVGFNFSQLQQLFNKMVSDDPGDRNNYKDLYNVPDTGLLAKMVDQYVDSALANGHTKLSKYCYELFSMRSMRKEYKVTAQDQVAHLLSIIYS